MEKEFNLYRKRYIPCEDNLLKDDIIIAKTDDFIITKWNVPKERDDFNKGYSILDFKNNIKFSKFLRDDELVYYYVDIVDYEREENLCRSIDLLVDVIILPDNTVKVLDLDELEEAHENGLITMKQVFKSLKYTDEFLKRVYNNEISQYFDLFKKYEKK